MIPNFVSQASENKSNSINIHCTSLSTHNKKQLQQQQQQQKIAMPCINTFLIAKYVFFVIPTDIFFFINKSKFFCRNICIENGMEIE